MKGLLIGSVVKLIGFIKGARQGQKSVEVLLSNGYTPTFYLNNQMPSTIRNEPLYFCGYSSGALFLVYGDPAHLKCLATSPALQQIAEALIEGLEAGDL